MNYSTIKLPKGISTIVDVGDFEFLSQWKWHLTGGYVSRTATIKGNLKRQIYLHRVINQTMLGFDTDHINGNKLDNRRHNLRTATRSQNLAHSKLIRSHNASGYRGVVWDKRNLSWVAQITFKGKSFFLGNYDDIKDAAKEYNLIAKKLFGEFAVLNPV